MSEIKKLFQEKLRSVLDTDPHCMNASGIKGVKIAIDIEHEGSWTFAFDEHGAVSMVEGLIHDCHCSVHTNPNTFMGVVKGSVNVPFAYMMKKIKVKGDVGLAVKVGLGIQKAIEGRK